MRLCSKHPKIAHTLCSHVYSSLDQQACKVQSKNSIIKETSTTENTIIAKELARWQHTYMEILEASKTKLQWKGGVRHQQERGIRNLV